MSARSSLLVLLACGGCDLVFGVDGQPEPCDLSSFDGATPRTIAEAESYSVDWDQTFAIVRANGMTYELPLPAGTPTPIDLGVYDNLGFGLTPEGHALFYTIAAEPMELKGALRGETSWKLDAEVPRGTFAGTPSADVFGPRRVLVRVRASDAAVQEFEDRDGRWTAVGTPLPVPGTLAPNLTPNGLTMVYAGSDEHDAPVIYAASRSSVDAPFGAPLLLLHGDYRTPQLCGRCQQLYVISGIELVRLDR